MPLHLIKLAVGVDDVEHLQTIQARRAESGPNGGPNGGTVPLFTGFVPKRAAEILEGGSLYWVIRGSVRARQRVLAVDTAVDAEGKKRCRLTLDVAIVPVLATPHRPFQGWRYLEPKDAPPDAADAAGMGDELPPHLVAELRALGLL
ncbi:MAG TPA: DUF1489 domain-containing protein [Azospirillaceae bacterium]|nr:DUF1489 domain-containing protein [Azospirillaceae bacterium]